MQYLSGGSAWASKPWGWEQFRQTSSLALQAQPSRNDCYIQAWGELSADSTLSFDS